MSLDSAAANPPLVLANERPQDARLAEALIDRAFGPGRFTKASERVREFATFAPELSMCAWAGDRLLGLARMWRIRVGDQPAAFLGPFAVEEGERSAGFGARLVARACEAAEAAGETHVVLVGDEAYFGRLGFAAEPARRVIMPGPVDQRRVLARTLRESPELTGAVGPR